MQGGKSGKTVVHTEHFLYKPLHCPLPEFPLHLIITRLKVPLIMSFFNRAAKNNDTDVQPTTSSTSPCLCAAQTTVEPWPFASQRGRGRMT